MNEILLLLAGYIALLLWGMRMVRTGIVRAYGPQLRRILGTGMKSRYVGWLSGLGVATLLQSSTATALLMASFAGAGLLELAPALAILLGANVGSSVVVQLLSLDLSWLPAPLLLGGALCYRFGRWTRQRDLGEALVGLGLMLLSLQMIVASSTPISESSLLQQMLGSLAGAPLFTVAIGAVLATVTHSSLAILLLVMSLANNLLPLPAALALVLGANLGSAIPAVMDTMQANPETRRVPMGNLIFKLVGISIALPLLPLATTFMPYVEADAARQVADYHTAFNLAVSTIFIFLIKPVSRLLMRLIPPQNTTPDPGRPRYLSNAEDAIPATVLACAEREALRLADIVEQMVHDTEDVFRRDDRKLCDKVERMDDDVDRLYAAIKFYLTRLDPEELDADDQERLNDTMAFITNLEHIGDIVEKNLMQTARKKISNQQQFSSEGWHEIAMLHEKLMRDFKLSVNAFISQDETAARQLLEEKHNFRTLEQGASQSHIVRLQHKKVASIETSALHLDILRDLKRINSHITAVAYPILERAAKSEQVSTTERI